MSRFFFGGGGQLYVCRDIVRLWRVLCPVFLTNLEGKVGKVGKLGKVGKVGRVGKVGMVGKVGKEGRLRE
jgi:hypothetical protein